MLARAFTRAVCSQRAATSKFSLGKRLVESVFLTCLFIFSAGIVYRPCASAGAECSRLMVCNHKQCPSRRNRYTVSSGGEPVWIDVLKCSRVHSGGPPGGLCAY